MRDLDKRAKPVKMTRRGVLIAGGATMGARFAPQIVHSVRSRRVLTLIYDKSIGAMRAIDRIVP